MTSIDAPCQEYEPDSISSENVLDLCLGGGSLASMSLQPDDRSQKAQIAAPRGFLRAGVVTALAIVFLGAAIGFVGFLSQLRGAETKPDRKADGIVVLTRGSPPPPPATQLSAARLRKTPP